MSTIRKISDVFYTAKLAGLIASSIFYLASGAIIQTIKGRAV